MRLLCSLLVLFFSSWATASYFSGSSLQPVDFDQFIESIPAGTVLVVGEVHNSDPHHAAQRDLMLALSKRRGDHALSLGMEFIDYTQQGPLDNYLTSATTESDFLQRINMSPQTFSSYRTQVLLPSLSGGWTYGINLPRSITGKVSRLGLQSLDDQEKALLPPNFQLGNEAYRKRFEDVMKNHVPEKALANYFAAQSLWDDTMAWQTKLRMDKSPEGIFVIIVGEFHVAWNGGLPDRLRERGWDNVITISQVRSEKELVVHPEYGPRADYVFVSNEPEPSVSLQYDLFWNLTRRH